jgi:hypothetical protein
VTRPHRSTSPGEAATPHRHLARRAVVVAPGPGHRQTGVPVLVRRARPGGCRAERPGRDLASRWLAATLEATPGHRGKALQVLVCEDAASLAGLAIQSGYALARGRTPPEVRLRGRRRSQPLPRRRLRSDLYRSANHSTSTARTNTGSDAAGPARGPATHRPAVLERRSCMR